MSIKVTDVSKLYGEQKALDKVSFEVKSGEIVGFLGPNGAGKSTMMKIITGFIPPSEGSVFIHNMDVVKHSLEIRRILGYLPENNPLYTDMYVREYLRYVAGIYKIGKTSKEKVDQIIEQTGLSLEYKKKIGELSKGYRQRVGLAQALVHNPEVLILDEPTSGLDPNQIIEIRNLIKEIGKEKTVLFSTHIMQEVEAICQKIIIINQGKIVAYDKTSEIQKYTLRKEHVVQVEFSEKVNTQDIEKIKGVQKIKYVSGHTYLIQHDENKDIRTEIFNFAVQHKIAVLSMQKIEMSLEEIFQELTRKQAD